MSLLRPIRETSAISVGLARERVRELGWRRLLVAWLLQGLVLLVVGWLIPGIFVEDLAAALIGAAVIGLLNALVRPVLILLTLPITVGTAGLLSLLINAIVLVLAAPLVPGLEVTSVWSAVTASIILAVIGTLLSVILSTDQDETFYAELTRRLASLERRPIEGGRGLVIIQIDGLAAPILRNAIRIGTTPQMARWVRSGSHRLIEWSCVPPSQTSSSQAGILHGENASIPAFRWFEKDTGRLMVSNRPADAAEIERRISDGQGLLAADGMSAGNLFSGDARRTLLTMSRVERPQAAVEVDAFTLYFVDPTAFIRTVVLTIGEMIKEWTEARRQRSHDILPRVHRGIAFAVMRAASNVLLRDLNMTFLINAIGRGTPIMYADFVDYDELAHHAGPERLESLRTLSGVDRVLTSIERAIRHAPRDYDIVVLSDHGQSQGATFLQRYGRSLDAVVRDLMDGAPSLTMEAEGEGWGPVNALLAEISRRPGLAGRATSSAIRAHSSETGVAAGPSDALMLPLGVDTSGGGAAPRVVVGASGNLANIYLLDRAGRVTLEEIQASYPKLVVGLAAHPGIGFVLVRSEALGPLAIGAEGVHRLRDGHVDGTDPLAPFGDRTAADLLRLDACEHVGDILVNSVYDPSIEEIAAFEELVGSHGGFGGAQTRPFLLAPARLSAPLEPLVGAPAIYGQLRRWADELGVGPTSGATDAPLVDAARGRRPRGLGVVAALTGLAAVVWLLLGSLLLIGGLETGAAAPFASGAVFVTLGIAGLGVTRGLLRRREWARVATLVWYAVGVVQALGALATEGIAGLISLSLLHVATSVAIFFYLTRPHVRAAFTRSTDPP